MTKVWVLILTKQRYALLEKCLTSLLKAMTYNKKLEIQLAVIVNGPDLGSQKVVEAFAGKGALRAINLPVELGPAAARNVALAGLEPGWICFLDDDVEVPADYFQTFEELHRKFPVASVFGGPNLTPLDSNFVQKISGEMLASFWGASFCSGRYKKKYGTKDASEILLILCNLWIRSEVMQKNPFPEKFICGEENSILAQMRKQNISMVAADSLFVWHERRSRWVDFYRQIRKYAIGRGQNLFHLQGSWFHGVPTLALVAFVLNLCGYVHLQALVALYFILNAGFSARVGWLQKSLAGFILSFLGFPLIHLFYALGVPEGLLREWSLSNRAKVPSPDPVE